MWIQTQENYVSVWETRGRPYDVTTKISLVGQGTFVYSGVLISRRSMFDVIVSDIFLYFLLVVTSVHWMTTCMLKWGLKQHAVINFINNAYFKSFD